MSGNQKTNQTRPAPLRAVYRTLYRTWGPQHWWPGRTRLEIIVGAILTQNTAWTNVERAIRRLRQARALNLPALRAASLDHLAGWIRPAGYFNVKARRLKSFVSFLYASYAGRLDRLFAEPDERLRRTLLSVNGIGPETADSILLYAAQRPVFVVDAYTRRVLVRHGWIRSRATYDDIASFMTAHLPRDIRLFNEFHALIVRLGEEHCRPTPRCDTCPLQRWLPPGGARRVSR